MNGFLVLARTSLFEVPLFLHTNEATACDLARHRVTPEEVAMQFAALFGEEMLPDAVEVVGYVRFVAGVPVRWVPVRQYDRVTADVGEEG